MNVEKFLRFLIYHVLCHYCCLCQWTHWICGSESWRALWSKHLQDIGNINVFYNTHPDRRLEAIVIEVNISLRCTIVFLSLQFRGKYIYGWLIYGTASIHIADFIGFLLLSICGPEHVLKLRSRWLMRFSLCLETIWPISLLSVCR